MSTNVIKIESLERIIIFGAGNLVVDFINESTKRAIEVHLFTVKRQLNEIYDSDLKLTFREILEKNKVNYYEIDDINTSDKLKSLITDKTIGIGMGETYTFSKEIIQLFKHRLFDFMTIRLPEYRGGAHFTWQILRQNRIGCWNIQLINEEMIPGVYDSGEIIKSREFIIPQSAQIPNDFFKVYSEEALKIFIEFIDDIQAGKEFNSTKLQENFSLYLPRLNTIKHGFIDWSWDTEEIAKFICAFDNPYKGASTFIGDQRLFLKNVQADYTEGNFHPFISGIIYRIYNSTVYVATNKGALCIKEVLDDNGTNIISSLKVGIRFYTPKEHLDKAMMYSAEYNTQGLVEK